MVPSITIFFTGLFAVAQVPLTVFVGDYRRRTGIQFFDGGDPVLLRRMRAHGNFTETVPMVLLAMAAAEAAGAPGWLLWAGGALLAGGRFLHALTLVRSGWGNGRAAGMIMTLTPMLVFGGFAFHAALVR